MPGGVSTTLNSFSEPAMTTVLDELPKEPKMLTVATIPKMATLRPTVSGMSPTSDDERGGQRMLCSEIHRLLAEQTDRVLYRLDAIADQIHMCRQPPGESVMFSDTYASTKAANHLPSGSQPSEHVFGPYLHNCGKDDEAEVLMRQSKSSLRTIRSYKTAETATVCEWSNSRDSENSEQNVNLDVKPRSAVQQKPSHESAKTQSDTIQSIKTKFAIERTDRMMKRLLEVNEQEKLKLEKLTSNRWKDMTRDDIETMIDSVMAVVICLNAAFIGVSMDYSSRMPNTFLVADIMFTCIFISELVLKTFMKGFCGHFCGKGDYSNCLDAAIIFVDFFQLLLVMILPDAAENVDTLPSASLFRMIRLIKLTRIIRLLRSEVFKELLSMIRGLIGGVTVLLWSIVLFLMVLYIVSLVFREALGRDRQENVYEYFDSVPRAMYTTFRCSFGDCSTASGQPIFEHVHLRYGATISLIYCVITFVITIGIFNVISAIFVESTMTAREASELFKLRARIEDENLWSTKVTTLLIKLLSFSPDHADKVEVSGHIALLLRGDTHCLQSEKPENSAYRASFVDSVDKLVSFEIECSALDAFIKDPDVILALAELDIDPEDNAHLSDIFDPDNGGTICLRDFVDGLRRLRGKPKRSDIVAVDLMIRSIQLQIADLCEIVPQILEAVKGVKPQAF